MLTGGVATKRSLAWVVVLLVLSVPPTLWWGVKPLRLVAPGWVGLVSVGDGVYVDDPGRAAEARLLYRDAIAFVRDTVGPIRRSPRVVFCATLRCFDSFGVRGPAAHYFGSLGLVVAPRGWTPHYVRHELIHHVQAEQLGFFPGTPAWFTEGMDALSGDPREVLAAPQQEYRARFRVWYEAVGRERLWLEAGRLQTSGASVRGDR